MDFFSNFTPTAFTRRAFLGRGLVLASAASTVPAFVQRSAHAMLNQHLSSIPGVPDERVLVVVQLAGGNDGLSTVIPYLDPTYYRVRPTIGIAEKNVLKLDRGASVGLHPQLAGLKELYDEGLLAVVQGVGYPNPNRSHFQSTDIWETAELSGTGTGWLGRYFDAECCGKDPAHHPDPEPLAGIAIGKAAPPAMEGGLSKPIAFETPEHFRWLGTGVDKTLETPYDTITHRGEADAGVDSNESFLMRTALDAQISSAEIRKAVSTKPTTPYPGTGLGRDLAMVASMIRAKLKTRVYYVTLGGFDTHAGQGAETGRHAQLMQQLGAALKAFYADLKAQGNDQRVLTMTFSEFGRRVAQNASGGTDHGTAAPMFIAGPMVKAGVVGTHPSLTNLDAGDLRYQIDFRSVYASILDRWLKADSRKVLGGSFGSVPIVRA